MRPVGSPKTPGSGRQKGTPNKGTQDLFAICESKGVNVFEAMLQIMLDTDSPFDKFSMLKELAQYLYPKRKTIEVSADVNLELAQKAEEYANMPKEEQIRLMEEQLKILKGE